MEQRPAHQGGRRHDGQSQHPFQTLPPHMGGDGGRLPGADALGAVGAEGGLLRENCAAVGAFVFHRDHLFHVKVAPPVSMEWALGLRMVATLLSNRQNLKSMVLRPGTRKRSTATVLFRKVLLVKSV